MTAFLEACLLIFTFLLFLHHLESLLWGPLGVGLCVSIQNTHIINAIHTLLPEFLDKKVSFLFLILSDHRWIVRFLMTVHIDLHTPHGTDSVDEVVSAHAGA